MSRNTNQTANRAHEGFDISMLISWDTYYYQWRVETAQQYEAWHAPTQFYGQFRSIDSASFTIATTAATASTLGSRSAVFLDSQEFEDGSFRATPQTNESVGPKKAKLPVRDYKQKSAEIWSRFEQGARKDTGQPKVFCKRCRASMGHGSAGSSGTNTMNTHYKSARCKNAVPAHDIVAGGSQPQQQRITNMPGIVSHVITRVRNFAS